MKLDRYEKNFHLKLQKPKEPQLTEEDKTVVSQTDNYFQLWHGTPNKPIAGNKIDEEEMRNLFGQVVTHFVKHTTKGNGMYQLPPGSSCCTIVTKIIHCTIGIHQRSIFNKVKKTLVSTVPFAVPSTIVGGPHRQKQYMVMPWKIFLLEGSHLTP